MKFKRRSGILLHPTSLPGPYGIGDLGQEAYNFVDFLINTGCTLWQVLPLGPTGYGDSPYQCFSAFAGNPYLISPDLLISDGLLEETDLAELPDFSDDNVDYGAIIPWKLLILDKAFQQFTLRNPIEIKTEFNQFKKTNYFWLRDFATFMTLKDIHNGAPWPSWEKSLRDRDKNVLDEIEHNYTDAIQNHMFRQFLFYRQWKNLREYANSNGVQIIGDIPIFVAHDSAEVWANPELFYINKEGNPTVVAGVPPDYFSPTGQLWGNPLYQWKKHAESNFSWWLQRMQAVLEMVDIVRLDHFRGFAGYWEIPATEKTAVKGRWVPGPGNAFFKTLRDELGVLPILAEDLGEITPDVIELRDQFNLPGMKILVFAFSDNASNEFLPHNYFPNTVVYTGTHDNDTIIGWYERVEESERDFARRYLGRSGNNISWDLIRLGWSSVAMFAIAQMQDILELGNEARMNYPSRPSGNWMWRMPQNSVSKKLIERLLEFNILYGRGEPPKSAEEVSETGSESKRTEENQSE